MPSKADPDHSFVILANSLAMDHLEECVQSIMNQTVLGEVVLSACRMNDTLSKVSKSYDIPVVYNPSTDKGIASNWSFAYRLAQTKHVTLAHDDDVYVPDYLKLSLQRTAKFKDTILTFTDYSNLVDDKLLPNALAPSIKRRYCRFAGYPNGAFVSKRSKMLLIGLTNMVTVSTVMFNKSRIGPLEFNSQYKQVLDWEAFIRLARMDGRFVFINSMLLHRRIHANSYTTKNIKQNTREKEIYELLTSMWGPALANVMVKLHKLNQ